MKIRRIKIGNFFLYEGSINDRCALASSPDITYAQLKELVIDSSVMVRIRLAHRNYLPDEIVQILLNDISSNVRFAILNNEKNEISLGQLWAMSEKDEEDFIQKKALERLIEGNDKEVCIPSIFFTDKKSKKNNYGGQSF